MLGSSRNVCGIKWGTNTITSYILKGILTEQLLAADAGLGRKVGGLSGWLTVARRMGICVGNANYNSKR